MYFSQIFVNTGDETGTFRPGRLWLDNMHTVHDTLQQAFTHKIHQVEADEEPGLGGYEVLCDFPFGDETGASDGCDIPELVEIETEVRYPFLFRAECTSEASTQIIVTSSVQPNWEQAFSGSEYLLADHPPRVTLVQDEYLIGTVLRFRLLAHPVFTESDIQHGPFGTAFPSGAIWPREQYEIPLEERTYYRWLEIKGFIHGFRIEQRPMLRQGLVYTNKTTQPEHGHLLLAVQYEGLLRIMDEDKFTNTLLCGIGPAKSHGFGLLSVAFPRCNFIPTSSGY